MLVQVCIVIVTIGLLAMALQTVRMLTRFFQRAEEDLSQLTGAVRESAARFDQATHEARELLASLRDCVAPMQRAVDRFEVVGRRTADLSSVLIEELERPVFIAAAVARGVRSGGDHFLKRPMRRFDHRQSQIHGGYDHE